MPNLNESPSNTDKTRCCLHLAWERQRKTSLAISHKRLGHLNLEENSKRHLRMYKGPYNGGNLSTPLINLSNNHVMQTLHIRQACLILSKPLDRDESLGEMLYSRCWALNSLNILFPLLLWSLLAIFCWIISCWGFVHLFKELRKFSMASSPNIFRQVKTRSRIKIFAERLKTHNWTATQALDEICLDI